MNFDYVLIKHLRVTRRRADPGCSMLVAACIFASALPLLSDASVLLLLRTPEALRGDGWTACVAALRA